ncbi:MAG TPA: NAD(P)-dependent oxidoreductase [Candidatus Acidoferrales bacterium]|nr:NAD(P)-dependent oxidoreductase [Candidatus Acidoferrales bacterium]
MKVGFLGLGNMGSEMARNLIKAGHSLTVYNKTQSRAEELASLGAKVARTPGQAASDVEAIITMVADDAAIESIVLGHNAAIHSLPAGAVHIAMSTMSVAMSRRLVAAHRERRQHFVSAPVFGRPDAAEAAKLVIAAAGPADQIARCQPLFDAMGQKTYVVGDDPPAANVVKVAGNFLITVVIESLGESFALIKKSGVDADKFLEVLVGSLFAAPVYRTYGPMVAANNFEPVGFRMALGMKDNRLVLAAAEDVAVPLPLASLIRDRMLAATAQGMADADWSAIARLSFKEAGL